MIQDMTAVDSTTVIISYSMRSGAENAAFAMSGVSLGGSVVTVTLYHTNSDPQFMPNPQHTPILSPPSLNLPNYSLGPGFGASLFQAVGSLVGAGTAQPAVALPGTSHQPHNRGGGGGAGASGGSSPQDILSKYTTPWVAPPPQQGDPPQCSICLLDLSDTSSYSTTNLA